MIYSFINSSGLFPCFLSKHTLGLSTLLLPNFFTTIIIYKYFTLNIVNRQSIRQCIFYSRNIIKTSKKITSRSINLFVYTEWVYTQPIRGRSVVPSLYVFQAQEQWNLQITPRGSRTGMYMYNTHTSCRQYIYIWARNEFSLETMKLTIWSCHARVRSFFFFQTIFPLTF